MATLSVTHTESITLNDREQGGKKTFTVANIVDVYKRTVTCPAGSDTTVATFQALTSTSDNAIDLGIRQSQLESAPLPVVLLSFGLITLQQFQILLDWIENNQ